MTVPTTTRSAVIACASNMLSQSSSLSVCCPRDTVTQDRLMPPSSLSSPVSSISRQASERPLTNRLRSSFYAATFATGLLANQRRIVVSMSSIIHKIFGKGDTQERDHTQFPIATVFRHHFL